jgi:hypothetical protein
VSATHPDFPPPRVSERDGNVSSAFPATLVGAHGPRREELPVLGPKTGVLLESVPERVEGCQPLEKGLQPNCGTEGLHTGIS